MTTSLPQLHPIPSAQKRLGIGRSKTFQLIDSGELRSVKVGSRRLIPESAIAEYIDRLISDQCPKGVA